jgi:hypothetical protein
MVLTTLYSAINIIRGGGNPTTFARMELFPVSSSIQAVKPSRFHSVFCFIHLEPYHVLELWLLL